jgi:hypothetical protein
MRARPNVLPVLLLALMVAGPGAVRGQTLPPPAKHLTPATDPEERWVAHAHQLALQSLERSARRDLENAGLLVLSGLIVTGLGAGFVHEARHDGLLGRPAAGALGGVMLATGLASFTGAACYYVAAHRKRRQLALIKALVLTGGPGGSLGASLRIEH